MYSRYVQYRRNQNFTTKEARKCNSPAYLPSKKQPKLIKIAPPSEFDFAQFSQQEDIYSYQRRCKQNLTTNFDLCTLIKKKKLRELIRLANTLLVREFAPNRTPH